MAQEGEAPQVVNPEAPHPPTDLERAQYIFRNSHALVFDGIIKTDVLDWMDYARFVLRTFEIEPQHLVSLARSSLIGYAAELFAPRPYEPSVFGWAAFQADMWEFFQPSAVFRRYIIRSFHWRPLVGEPLSRYLDRFRDAFLPVVQVNPNDHAFFCDALLRSIPSRFSVHAVLHEEMNLTDLIQDIRDIIPLVMEHEEANLAGAPNDVLTREPPPAPSTPDRDDLDERAPYLDAFICVIYIHMLFPPVGL